MSQSQERSPAQEEVDQLAILIQGYDDQLSALDARLQELEEENRSDEAMMQVKKYHQEVSNDNIQVDDALDRVIHLETQLKIMRRRNELIQKENRRYHDRVRRTGNSLQKSHDELDMVIDVTGWHEGYFLDKEGLNLRKQDVHHMTVLETKVRREIKTTAMLSKKKQDTLVKLREQVEAIQEKQNKLNEWYNKIRVQQRDNAERQAHIEVLRRDDEELSRELVALEESKTAMNGSIAILEADKAFLIGSRRDIVGSVAHQNRLTRAQQIREDQLRRRLSMLTSCLKDLKLEKAFQASAKSIEGGAVVRTQPEPQQLSDIIPEDEQIPVDAYRLVYYANGNLEGRTASRSMLLLERESVVYAMEAQLLHAMQRHNTNVYELDARRFEKGTKARQLIEDIQSRHQAFRTRMEELTRENTRLRNELAQKNQRERR